MTRRTLGTAGGLVLGTLAATLAGAQSTGRAAVLLEQGIQKEAVDGDIAGAIAAYNTILSTFADDRAVAARALWRLGQSYERIGAPEARRAYERLVREYADQSALASAARARLAAMAAASPRIDPVELVVGDTASRPTAPVMTGATGAGNFVVFSDLAVLNRGTGQSRRLVAGARSAAYPVVSPGGLQVAYLAWTGDLTQSIGDRARERDRPELRIVGIDGSGDRPLLSGSRISWLRPYAFSPDGRHVLTVIERPNGSNDVALVGVSDGAARVLTTLDTPAPQNMSFSPDGRHVAYEVTSARDARLVEMVLIPLVGSPAGSANSRRYAIATGGLPAAPVSNAELVVHVLNRLGFGPRPGDVERVAAMGVDAYIDQQLFPERIADPVVDARLAPFASLRMTIPELLARMGPASPVASRRRATVFERRRAIDGAAGRDDALRPALGSSARPEGEAARRALFGGRPRDYEIHTARFIRAIYSERQLQEVMVDFWMNHFSINHGDDQLTAHFEESVIRRHALGRFEDLLMGVARHPRMLYYLDNWRSSAPADVIQQRVSRLKETLKGDEYIRLFERQPFLQEAKGLNENFARELMELHTMGVDSGYTQQDIVEVAKILTGWTISAEGLTNGRENDGAFVFDPLLHVEGDKQVLGRTFKSGGIEEGEELLRMLASHPATARYIATKVARRFVADDPPGAVIDAATRVFRESKGDIRQVLRAVFTSPQFRSAAAYRSKIKKPLELVVSSLRAVGAEIDDYDTYGQLTNNNRGVVGRMGERVYDYEAPDGNPDVGAAWMNSNALLVRLDFANALATGRLPGITVNLRAAELLLEQLGLPRPTPDQVEQTRAMLKTAAASGAGSGSMVAMMGRSGGSSAPEANFEPAAIVVATMLGSPQFQKR
jgi:uncharacterized protein (DUF1800 family)